MENIIKKEDFLILSRYIRQISGIALEYDKEYLMNQRLQKILTQYRILSFADLAAGLPELDSEAFRSDIIAAITTNETSFFRDPHFFETIEKNILPYIAEYSAKENRSGEGRIKIWSAACSTGQEPYSLAMLLHDFTVKNPELNLSIRDFSVYATDINEQNLKYMKSGIYRKNEVWRGLTEEQISRFFRPSGDSFEIIPEIKKIIRTEKLNLTDLNYPVKEKFDLILLRNVLIYFSPETASEILNNISGYLHKKGFLVMGSSENIYGQSDRFSSVINESAVIYRKKNTVSLV